MIEPVRNLWRRYVRWRLHVELANAIAWRDYWHSAYFVSVDGANLRAYRELGRWTKEIERLEHEIAEHEKAGVK